MMKTFFVFSLITLVFVSCQKDEDTTATWDISGKVVMTDAQVPEIETPLEGINMYLVHLPFTTDSSTMWVVTEDIADSTQTGANGEYYFKNLAPGDYIVLPYDTTRNYNFNWDNSPDSIWIDAASQQKQYEINFSTPEPVEENWKLFYDFYFHCYGDFSDIQIKVYRTARLNVGCGWLGLSPCDWHHKWLEECNLHYRPGDGMMNPPQYLGSSTFNFHFMNNILYSFKDEFHFKFVRWQDNKTELLHTFTVSADEIGFLNSYYLWISDDGTQISTYPY